MFRCVVSSSINDVNNYTIILARHRPVSGLECVLCRFVSSVIFTTPSLPPVYRHRSQIEIVRIEICMTSEGRHIKNRHHHHKCQSIDLCLCLSASVPCVYTHSISLQLHTQDRIIPNRAFCVHSRGQYRKFRSGYRSIETIDRTPTSVSIWYTVY